MATKQKGGNQLLLLAGTALVLCVAILSSGSNSLSNSLQGIVLSDRDEVKEDNGLEERNKGNNERNREEEKKRLEIKVREKKSSPEPTQTRERDEERSREGSEFEIETDGVKVTTDSPLKLNTRTNELSVTSKNGEIVKVVVLPDQAVENLASNRNVEIVGETVLEENDETGEFEYKAKVIEKKRLLGLFNIRLNKEYRVSSEDGSVEEAELSGIDRLLNLISF